MDQLYRLNTIAENEYDKENDLIALDNDMYNQISKNQDNIKNMFMSECVESK